MEQVRYRAISIAESIAASEDGDQVAVTFETCGHVRGPFFHGTANDLAIGDLLVPGRQSNYQTGRLANHVYFSALVEPAVWAAELAVALGERTGRGRIYVVEPTGPFEDDPNVTGKRFPGNPTRSYRTREPLMIVDELDTWDPHPPEVLEGMLANLARLRSAGLDVVEN